MTVALYWLVAVLLTAVADQDRANNGGTPSFPASNVNQEISITATNLTPTSVLLQWNGSEWNGSEGNCYNVSYVLLRTTNPENEENGISLPSIRTICEGDDQLDTATNSVLLVSLKPNCNYCVKVCIIDEFVCAMSTFITRSTTGLTHQVEDVQVHVFNPLLNNDLVVSAQIFWTALRQHVQPSFYDVRVRTADEDMTNITNQTIPSQNTFTNIVTRTELNEVKFPLTTDKIYYVQVRGRNANQNFSWSEPVLINTLSDERQEPQFLVRKNTEQLQLYFAQNSPQTLLSNVGWAIAIDKFNRSFYYYNSTANSNRIMRADIIDTQYMPQVVVDLPTSNKVLAMTYDWISKRLYFVLASEEEINILCYTVIIPERAGEYECVLNVSYQMIRQMTINPFTGKLHLVQQNNLVTIDVGSLEYDVIERNLSVPTLAESVLQDCVYVIKDNGIKGTGESCSYYMIKKFEGENRSLIRLATDDKGIYYSDGSNIHFYEYESNENSIHTTQFSSGTIDWFDVISPGSHPFPRQQSCLSPVISATEVYVNRNATSLLLEWEQPDTTKSTNCSENIVSVPPILYIIDIRGVNNIDVQQFQTYRTSLNVTVLNSSLAYDVRLRAKTDFFIGLDKDIPTLGNRSVAPFTAAETIVSTMTPASTTTTFYSRQKGVSTIPSMSTRTLSTSTVSTAPSTTTFVPAQRTPAPGNSGSNTAIVAGVTGGVGFIILVLVIVVVIVSVLACTRSRKSYKMNSNSARYIRRESNDQPNNFPSTIPPTGSNQLQNPTPYESPMTLSTKSLLTNSNGSATDPYAIPADSLDQYRTAESLGQVYEVPLPSRSNTLANNSELPHPSNEPHPPINVYSTLDDATIEKQVFTQSGSVSIPNKYSSLNPANMSLPHSYGHFSSEIKEAPKLYSEPIASPRRTSKGSLPVGVVKRSSKVSTVRGNGADSFDNPVYGFELTNQNGATMATDNHTYSSLDRSVEGVPDHSNSQSDPRSHTALGKTYSTLSDVRDESSEPTYFELQNPQEISRARSKSHNPNEPEPTYSNAQNRSVSPAGEPTYFLLEKPTKDPAMEPTYFELEKPKHSLSNNPSNDEEDITTADYEPTYFEVKPRKSISDPLKQQGGVDNRHYETSHQYSELSNIKSPA